jgi:hypothetical protein
MSATIIPKCNTESGIITVHYFHVFPTDDGNATPPLLETREIIKQKSEYYELIDDG